jgi:Fe-S-cluster containining protein
MNFLECGTCTECCRGNLSGVTYGTTFGNGKPCTFLVKNECYIYCVRPVACRKYQCAWSQNLFEDWMKPEKSGVLVSVENDNEGKQYLKVVTIRDKKTDDRAIPYLEEWVKKHNTYMMQV